SRLIYMELATNRNDKADELQTSNEDIVVNETFEQNEQIVNEAYSQYIKNGSSSLDFTQLANVAFQCPGLGGNSVFKARTLYRLHNDSIGYNDDSLCLYAASNMRKVPKKKNLPKLSSDEGLVIHPNPTNGELSLTFKQPSKEPVTWLLFNTMGQLVHKEQLLANQLQHKIMLDKLPSGVYHYNVYNSGHNKLYQGKVVIVH
ncbi:MAG: T9SS type A sorting domain-containing protein, partial [Bacteroidia bacterium]